MRRLFSSFAVKVQVSDACVTTGLIIVLYIFFLVFFFKSFDFISFELSYVECFVTFCYSFSSLYIHFIIRIQNKTQVIKIFHIFDGKIINF